MQKGKGCGKKRGVFASNSIANLEDTLLQPFRGSFFTAPATLLFCYGGREREKGRREEREVAEGTLEDERNRDEKSRPRLM